MPILFVHDVFSLLFSCNFLSIWLRENEKQKINVEKSILMSETVGVAIRSQRNKTLFSGGRGTTTMRGVTCKTELIY